MNTFEEHGAYKRGKEDKTQSNGLDFLLISIKFLKFITHKLHQITEKLHTKKKQITEKVWVLYK